jgi:hypothetical protein
MERRPISDQIRQWLLGEMEAWRAGGILADDQPRRILDVYETATEAAGRRRSLATFAVSGVAALMIGLAALLVVSYNWQALSWACTGPASPCDTPTAGNSAPRSSSSSPAFSTDRPSG